jgi:hypothetical protein
VIELPRSNREGLFHPYGNGYYYSLANSRSFGDYACCGVPKSSLRLTVLFLVSIYCSITNLYAQAPTLNPDQTVNLGTGEMGFALPLGTAASSY